MKTKWEWQQKNVEIWFEEASKKLKEINMWNYVTEKLPEKQEMGVSDHVIVAEKGCTYARAGYYDYDAEAWFVDGCGYPVDVYAWAEVKPPKEAE